MNQQQQKSPIEEAQRTAGFVVELIHASVLLLRLFSRVPSSIGGGMLFPGVFLSLICMALFSHHPERSVNLEARFISIMGWLWMVHFVAYLLSWRGRVGTYTWATGRGWLNQFNPNSKNPILLAIASDVIAAAILYFICQSQGDKGFAQWWVISGIMSPVSHSIFALRDAARRRMVGSAYYQQRHWQSHIPMEDDLE